ncbi:MAG: hypothetical protein M3R63_21830 [Actinomycetota bacterium]|nr:hypothetical protein [Actinomycetota bacterium]
MTPLDGDKAQLGMCMMEGSATANEQQYYIECLMVLPTHTVEPVELDWQP